MRIYIGGGGSSGELHVYTGGGSASVDSGSVSHVVDCISMLSSPPDLLLPHTLGDCRAHPMDRTPNRGYGASSVVVIKRYLWMHHGSGLTGGL